jgi:transcriptional regulator with XRE-family HTH domain
VRGRNKEKVLELVAFGNTLRNIRKENGYTQDQLSIYSRVDRSFISEMENGEKAPTLLTLISLAKALQMKSSALVQKYELELEKLQNLT